VGNAIKFTERGAIAVGVARVEEGKADAALTWLTSALGPSAATSRR
jgi:hypothetical protein